MPMDTTASSVPTDSVAAPAEVDSTQLSFLWGINHVKLYRDDMQMSCDSLVYNDLDSLFRLYRDPLVFSDGNRQYAADSIYVVVRNRKAERARLMGNAFITTEEAVDCYDQIRGAEMMAYFDTTRTLTRFDALGGATALFFLQENDALATVNKVESKMLYALFDKGNLDKVYYFQEAKNDAYPVVQLPREERYMKGFRWDPERRPDGKGDITPLVPRKSQRLSYLARPHAQFKETEIYFPGHIKKIYREIAERDSMAVVRSRQLKETPAPEVKAPVAADTLATPADTLVSSVDTLGMPALPVDNQAVSTDSLGRSEKGLMPEDALPEPKDSAAALPDPIPDKGSVSVPEETSKLAPLSAKKEAEKAAERARKAEEKRQKEEQRRLKAEEKARLDAQKQAEREARWAEEDKIYEEKQAARAQKKLEKERQKKLRALRKLEKKAQKERRIFERYLEKERAKADKKAAREAEKARKAAEKAAEKAASKQ